MKPGQVLKKHRLKKNLTLEELAGLTSFSLSYLSKLERSDRIPPFATLQTLAAELNFDITNVLNIKSSELETEGDKDIIILRKEQHKAVEEGENGYKLIPLTTSYKNKALSPFLMSVFPGQTRDFTHDAEEFIYVLQGTVKIVYKGSVYSLKEGDSVYLDSRYVHSFINESENNIYLFSINYIYRKF